jgi:L-threonylcarbamoyladenylate synthase
MGRFFIRQTGDILQHSQSDPRKLMASTPQAGMTRIVPADSYGIAEAARLLRAGKLVAFPTETVYGLGANALDEPAVAAIFAAKERPRFNPLIVHVEGREQADELVVFNKLASALAEAFWPGGLTLVLPRREPSPLALLVSAGLATAAVRSPAHPVAHALIEAAGVPLAAPSANRSGRISPTRAADVAEELGARVDLILDGGPCPLGIESTVIGFDEGRPILLRPGAVPREEIERVLGPVRGARHGIVQAPGMLASHYAPRARLRLNANRVEPGEALLAFGPDVPPTTGPVCNLSVSCDLQEAAANLFAMLRQLDRSGAAAIAVMPIPESGLGEAINDRLARAASPREE